MITPQELRTVNRKFRQSDASDLWPICGRFNVTERAIKRTQKFQRESGIAWDSADHYTEFLDQSISEIVNNPANW